MIEQQLCRVILHGSRVLHIDRLIPDKWYLQMLYMREFNKRLDLKDPKTFNEKLQWLKLYDRRPEYVTMVDKYAVKDYVAKIIGEEYIIPTIGVWNKPEDIDWEKLPNQFVLKCTHDSGGLVICRDKSNLDRNAAIEKLRKGLKRNYYWAGREWPYKNVEPKLLAEELLEDVSNINRGLVDYKFMCFNGNVKCCFTCTNRFSRDGLRVTFYDNDWKIMLFERSHPRETCPIQKPYSYEQMKIAAERLSEGLPFARIDFYEINRKPYFGEITLYPGGGYEAFQPEEWDYSFGSWIVLPKQLTTSDKKNK